jgi:GTP-binding protein
MNSDFVDSVEFHSSHHDYTKIPESPTMPQVAFCGRSNAGKSSLINSILSRKELVKVSSTPGKTRVLNFFLLNKKIFLVDLPGFGYSKASNSIRDNMIDIVNGYLNNTETLKILFILCDSARPLPDEEFSMIETCYNKDVLPVLVRTKVDKLNQKEKGRLKGETKGLKAEYPELQIISSSSKTALGNSEIQKLISAL